jgi:broad specificity phosphatase PhoE
VAEEMIYLVRHGETIWNLEGRRQGHLDSPLTDRGYAQAKAVARRLSCELVSRKDVRIISSPLGRATTTASIIAQHLGLTQNEIVSEPLLAEHHMGCWQGLTNQQVDDVFPGERKRRNANKWEYTIPRGESYTRLYERAAAWISTISEDWTVVAVTHAMIGRTIRGAYSCLNPDDMLALHYPHGVIYRLQQGKIDEIRCD